MTWVPSTWDTTKTTETIDQVNIAKLVNLSRKSMFDENKSNPEEDFHSLAAEHVPHLVIDDAIIVINTMIITMINLPR